MDTAGRVERFNKRRAATVKVKAKNNGLARMEKVKKT